LRNQILLGYDQGCAFPDIDVVQCENEIFALQD
jgi:hypothetical protein